LRATKEKQFAAIIQSPWHSVQLVC